MSWPDVLRWEMTRWCLWTPLIPFIIRFCTNHFYYSYTKKRFIITHLLAGVFFSLIHLSLFSLVFWFLSQFVKALALNLPLWNTLVAGLPQVLRTAQFDPQKIFARIFILDFHIGLLVYTTILIAVHAIEYSRRTADLNGRLSEARLEALKMQLHPHFLFNTLNSVSALLHKDPEAADEMIGELGDFLRLTLQSPSRQEVSLEEELKFLKSYLEIEKVRFQNRLTVQFHIEEQTWAAKLPNLILQPIIENAIRHAIAPREEPGTIEVRAAVRNNRLNLQILDDGPGMQMKDGREFTEGIGLQNVRERLRHHYGASHLFRLNNRPEGGLEVEIEIPFRTNSIESGGTNHA